MTFLISAATALGDSLFWAQLAGPGQSMGLACFPSGPKVCTIYSVCYTTVIRFNKNLTSSLSYCVGLNEDLISLYFKVSILYYHKSI